MVMLGVPEQSRMMENRQGVAVPGGDELFRSGTNAGAMRLLLGGAEDAVRMVDHVEKVNDTIQTNRLNVEFAEKEQKVRDTLRTSPELLNNPAAWEAKYQEMMGPVVEDLKERYVEAWMKPESEVMAGEGLEEMMSKGRQAVLSASMNRVAEMATDEAVGLAVARNELGDYEGAQEALGSPYIDAATRLKLGTRFAAEKQRAGFVETGRRGISEALRMLDELQKGNVVNGEVVTPGMREYGINVAKNAIAQHQLDYFTGLMKEVGETGKFPEAEKLREDLKERRISPSQYFALEQKRVRSKGGGAMSPLDFSLVKEMAIKLSKDYHGADDSKRADMEASVRMECDARGIDGKYESLVVDLLRNGGKGDVDGLADVDGMVEDLVRADAYKLMPAGRTVDDAGALEYAGSKYYVVDKNNVGPDGRYAVYERVPSVERIGLLNDVKARANELYVEETKGKNLSAADRLHARREVENKVRREFGIRSYNEFANIESPHETALEGAFKQKKAWMAEEINSNLQGLSVEVMSPRYSGSWFAEDSASTGEMPGLVIGRDSGAVEVVNVVKKEGESRKEVCRVSAMVAARVDKLAGLQVVVPHAKDVFELPSDAKNYQEKSEARARTICRELNITDEEMVSKVRTAIYNYWMLKR